MTGIDPLLSQRRQIAENLLSEIDWQEAAKGYCRCPGQDLHSGSSAKRDCTVFVEVHRAPTIFCVHTSCAAVVAEKNRALRSACGKARWATEHGGVIRPLKRKRLTAAERAARDRRGYLESLRRKAVTALPAILRRWSWPATEFARASPVPVGPVAAHWRLLLALFGPGDVVWIGNKKDSGGLRHRRFFRPADDWLREDLAPLGPLVAACTFQAGTWSRSKAQVAGSPFLVVESDTLDRDQIGAIYRFLRERENLPLRAIIDTAGRSFHAWFERPGDPARVEELVHVLPALGCDPGPLREPCLSRLPTAWRGTRQQQLVYLCPSA